MENLEVLLPPEIKAAFFGHGQSGGVIRALRAVEDYFSVNSSIFSAFFSGLVDENGANSKHLETTLEEKRVGNEHFKRCEYTIAVYHYTKALRYCPLLSNKGKSEASKIYQNRAFSLQNSGNLIGALRDCFQSIACDKNYSKAWFRMGKILSSLGLHKDSRRSFERAQQLEPSSKAIAVELNKLDQSDKGKDSSAKPTGDTQTTRYQDGIQLQRTSDFESVYLSEKIELVHLGEKGFGFIAKEILHPGEILLRESPFSKILNKSSRASHCHACFKDLSLTANLVPCHGCYSAVFCSEFCQQQSTWLDTEDPNEDSESDCLLDDLREATAAMTSSSDRRSHQMEGMPSFGEHLHECGGASWHAVLNEKLVLAVRLVVRACYPSSHKGSSLPCGVFEEFLLFSDRGKTGASDWLNLTASQKVSLLQDNIDQLEPSVAWSYILQSLTAAFCLSHSKFAKKFQTNPKNPPLSFAIFRALRLVDINSMVVKESPNWSNEANPPSNHPVTRVTEVSEKPIALAVYASGSFLNHSCSPNAFLSFSGSTVTARATETIEPGTQIEISYGPQIGFQRTAERQADLMRVWGFRCSCAGCVSPNSQSESGMDAYRCRSMACSSPVNFTSLEVEQSMGGMRGRHRCLSCLAEIEPGVTVSVAEETLGRLLRESDLDRAEECLETLEKYLFRTNLKLGKAHDWVAKICCSAGQYDRAISHLKCSVDILACHLPVGSLALAQEKLKLVLIALEGGGEKLIKEKEEVSRVFRIHYGRSPIPE